MQLGMRRIVFFGGGVCLLVAGTLVAVACSSDNGTTSGALPTVDAAKGDTGNATPPPPPPAPGDDGGDGGVDCTAAPKLRSNSIDFYCAFVDKGDGGGGFDGGDPRYCGNAQVCCNPSGLYADAGHFPSYCATDTPKPAANADNTCAGAAAAKDSAWDGGDSFECADKNNCGSGQVCCMYGTGITFADLAKNGSTPIPPACGAKYAKGITGTKCETGTTCGANEFVLCSLTDSCTATGATCQPFSGFFRDLGYCK